MGEPPDIRGLTRDEYSPYFMGVFIDHGEFFCTRPVPKTGSSNYSNEILIYSPCRGINIHHKTGGSMRQCMDADNIHRRIKKIIGQINAIDKMVDEDIPCEDILMQINAAKSALHKVGQVVLEGHLNHCVRDGLEHGDAEKTIAEFTKAVEHFSRMG